MTKCGCETGGDCTKTTVCQCALEADKLAEVLDNTLTALISVCLHDETPYTRDVIGDANKALKEYRG